MGCTYSERAQENSVLDPSVLSDTAFKRAMVPELPASGTETRNPGSAKPVADISSTQEPTVSTGELAAFDPAAVGVLDPADGGFLPSMWKGTSRALVEKGLPSLPVASPSPVMNSLARRLLLSRAEVPVGPSTVPSLLALRVERLMAAGWPNDVVRLIGRSAVVSDPSEVTRMRSDALFLDGDLPAACAGAEIMVRDSDDPYWLKAVTLCRVKAGDSAGAALAVELFLEQSETDPDFVELSTLLLGGGDGVPPLVLEIDVLKFFMLRSLATSLSPELEAVATPAMLRALANDQSLDLSRRLEIADRAASIGAVTGAELSRIYGGVAFAPDDLPKALDLAKTKPGSRSNALLYQFAIGDHTEDHRLQALQTLWRVAHKRGGLQIIAAATAALSDGLVPRDELSWFAADAVRASLASADLDRALLWYPVLTDEARARMWPLLAAADTKSVVPLSAEAVDLWLKTLADLTNEQKRRRAARVFSVLEALGHTIPDRLWQEALSEQAVSVKFPNVALLQLLDRAQVQNHFGEAIMYALKVLAPSGPPESHPIALAYVIRALIGLGLDGDARLVAIEALLGAGL